MIKFCNFSCRKNNHLEYHFSLFTLWNHTGLCANLAQPRLWWLWSSSQPIKTNMDNVWSLSDFGVWYADFSVQKFPSPLYSITLVSVSTWHLKTYGGALVKLSTDQEKPENFQSGHFQILIFLGQAIWTKVSFLDLFCLPAILPSGDLVSTAVDLIRLIIYPSKEFIYIAKYSCM